jgi:hypothetical protein
MRLMTLSLAAMLAAAAGAEAAPQKWTRVVTSAGFSLDQPVGWARVGDASDRVDIVSRGCRQPGVVICPGESEISVHAESIVARPKALKSKACWSMQETRSEADEGPGRRIESSELSCDIGARRFVIAERHWKGDKRAAAYGRIAIRMAKSLRYPG